MDDAWSSASERRRRDDEGETAKARQMRCIGILYNDAMGEALVQREGGGRLRLRD